MIQALWQFIKQYPIAYTIGSLFAIISGLIQIIPNYIIELLVDDIVSQQLSVINLRNYLLVFAVTMVAIYFIDNTWVILLFNKSHLYQKQLRDRLFRQLLTLRAPFYERFRSGDLMTRLTTDIDALGNTVGYGFLLVVADGTWFLSIIAVMVFSISWRITLVVLLPLIVFAFVVYYLSQEVNVRFKESRDSIAQMSNEVLEVVDGVRVMRAYGNRVLEQERFQARTDNVKKKANRTALINGTFRQVATLFGGLSIALGLAYGGYLVGEGEMTVGELVALQIYVGMLNGTIWGISDIFALFQQGRVSFDKISEVLKAEDLIERTGIKPIKQFETIEFQDYEFKYPMNEKTVLSHISFKLNRGETLGIVGKTGSGKTTIIRQLLRQYPVSDKGSILINGESIASYLIEDLEALIGYVPQEHILFSQSIDHNIRFGKEQATDFDLSHAIEVAHFTQDIERMEEGVNTLIGEKGIAISGGQKQRVSIARAMIREPELLILDDSLSAVDAKTEQVIITNIQTIRKGKTNIIVTHRLSAVNQANLVLVIEDGIIVEAGNPQTLLKQGGWYFEQYQMQQMKETIYEEF